MRRGPRRRPSNPPEGRGIKAVDAGVGCAHLGCDGERGAAERVERAARQRVALRERRDHRARAAIEAAEVQRRRGEGAPRHRERGHGEPLGLARLC